MNILLPQRSRMHTDTFLKDIIHARICYNTHSIFIASIKYLVFSFLVHGDGGGGGGGVRLLFMCEATTGGGGSIRTVVYFFVWSARAHCALIQTMKNVDSRAY